jgi:hypothetical protein
MSLKSNEKNAIANQSKEPLSEARYRLTLDEEALLFKYRESRTLLEKDCASAGIDPKDVKHFWYKSKLFSIFAKPKEKSIDDIKAIIIKDLQKYSPKLKTIVRKPIKDPHLLMISLADVHIGKLTKACETGAEYNVKIAVDRVKEGIEGLLQRSSGFNINKILLIIGNDILHTDTMNSTTTNGTHQNSDGMWHENFLKAKDLIVEVIEKLLPVADIHVIHNQSNHDFMSGFFLCQCVLAHFRHSKNVTFDSSPAPRKAFMYGTNLIGSTHGDGINPDLLPGLLAQEFSKEWSLCKHRYIFKHHVHHSTKKDYIGVTLQTLRSTSSTDSWHTKSGYTGVPIALEAFLHHPKLGQTAQFSYLFNK